MPVGTEVWAGYRGAQWRIVAGIDGRWRQFDGEKNSSIDDSEQCQEPIIVDWPYYGLYANVGVGGLKHNGNPSIENIWVIPCTDVWTGYRGGQWRQIAGGHHKGWGKRLVAAGHQPNSTISQCHQS